MFSLVFHEGFTYHLGEAVPNRPPVDYFSGRKNLPETRIPSTYEVLADGLGCCLGSDPTVGIAG